jgi:chromosome segregation ATPase
MEQLNMLRSSINQTEAESQRMDIEKAGVKEKIHVLEKSIMSLYTKIKEIRDDIVNHASDQKTIEKSSANLLKQTKQTYQKVS